MPLSLMNEPHFYVGAYCLVTHINYDAVQVYHQTQLEAKFALSWDKSTFISYRVSVSAESMSDFILNNLNLI